MGPSRPLIIVFGSDKALHSPLAKKLNEELSSLKLSFASFQSPNELKVGLKKYIETEVVCIFVNCDKVPPPLTGWKAVLSQIKKKPRFVVVSEEPILSSLKKDLNPELLVEGKNASLEELVNLFPEPKESTLSKIASNVNEAEVSLENSSMLSGSLLADVSPNENQLPYVTDTKIDIPNSDFEGVLEQSLDSASSPSASSASLEASALAPSLTGTEMGSELNLDAQIASSMSGSGGGIESMLPNSVLSNHDDLVLNELSKSSVDPKSMAGKSFDDLAAELEIPKLETKSNFPAASAPLHAAKSKQPSSKNDISLVAHMTQEASKNDSLVGGSKKDLSNFEEDLPEVDNLNIVFDSKESASDSATIQILKKYAGLKEKEIKEKDSTIESLKKQLRQVENKLRKSDEQRRKITLENEETVIKIRTLEAQVEQEKHHKSKLEQDHQEQIKDYKLRLENAEFQAKRLEKKLEDFRDRIKNDIQQIRHRERELANRLELQKRDAEALISSKDERLLLQKREIDRLEFEIDSLRDRIVEDTQKSEERAQKLMRAVQSLKLAQGVLSGIDEEVLPSAVAKTPKGRASSGEAA